MAFPELTDEEEERIKLLINSWLMNLGESKVVACWRFEEYGQQVQKINQHENVDRRWKEIQHCGGK